MKVGVLDMALKASIPQREAWSCVFPPGYGLPCQGWVYCEIVSHPLLLILMWVFLICPVCRSHSFSFQISFRGSRSFAVVDLAYPWE